MLTQQKLNTVCIKTFLLVALLFTSVFVSAQTNRANSKKTVHYRANYQRIAAGHNHTLEIRDGTLWAWGDNFAGALGDGTTVTKNSPVQIGVDTKWVSVSAGSNHSLGLKSDGTLWAWGYNNAGQLGDGTNVDKSSPVQVGVDTKWVSISAGSSHTLGLKSDGTLWAWGTNLYGRLGDGTTVNKNSPVQIGTDNKWVSITGGYFHSLGLKSDGTFWAWGYNLNGQLGDGTTVSKSSPVLIGVDNKWVNIIAGGNHSFGLKSDGTIWGWGNNAYGQLGDGTTVNKNSPVQIGTDTKWVSIAAGIYHTLGIKSDGTLWAWGFNNSGQLGEGSTVDKHSPVQIGTDTKWVGMTAGFYHTLGLKSDGTLWAWGRNSSGQLGDGTGLDSSSPIQISVILNAWLSTSEGQYHSLGIRSDGTLWAWGLNSSGQLGDGTLVDKNVPVKIGADNKWISITAGYTHSFGIKSDGTLWAWGYNFNGQLGDGTTANKNSPVQVGVDNKWVSITAGLGYTLGLKSDGTLWAWGVNQYGQLGDGTAVSKSNPIQIGVDNKWVSITTGEAHTLGLKSDGTLWAWGWNTQGQLGDGTLVNKSSPVQIGVDNKWVNITAGSFHTLGIKSDGTLWAWGFNAYGQLGDGTAVKKSSPVQIGVDNKWIGITTGGHHSFGIKSDGSLWGWGWNYWGQLGDGTAVDKNAPSQIGALNNWISITAGFYHTIGFKSDRSVFCATGQNGYGQLGNCTITTFNTVFICSTIPIAPPSPSNTSPVANMTICSGSNTTLTAGGTGTLGWYNAPSAGTYLGGGGTFNTPVLTTNTTYYVQDSSSCGGLASACTAILVTVNSLPAVSANATATTVCAGSPVTLTGGGATSYAWTGGVTNGVAFIPPSATTYTVTGTDVNSCTNTATITINLYTLPTVVANATATAVCMGTSVTLSGSGTLASYSWTGGVSNGIQFAPSATNTYTVTGTDGNGCQNTATKTITVNPLPTVTANASPSNSICYGQIVTLNGGGASSYTWTGGAGGIFNGIGFQPLTTATYSVTGTDGNGCQNTNTITVTVNPLPTVSSTASPSATLCAGENVTLNGAGANTYTWTGGVFNGASFTPASSVTYTVTGTDLNGCQNTNTRTVIVNSLPIVSANAAPSNVVCFGQNITLSGGGASTYSWTGGATNGIAFSASTSGTYTVTGTDGNGCQNTATKSITVNPLPMVTASVTNDTICLGSSTVLTAAGATNYNWSANAGSAVTASVSVSPATTETFTVTGTDLNSCSNTASLSVHVLLAATPSICMVTVDAASINNIIYWDKTSYTNADSFIVYREVSTLIYKRIGAVSVDSLSEYVDTARSIGPANGNPNVGSYRYKLQLRDTCGNYGSLSPYHNTIYIIDAGSGQFTWSIPYTIEGSPNPVANYVLLCDTANVDVWTPVGTVAGTQSSATDPGFANHATIANWRVKTAWSISCTPTRVVVNTTRSNIKHPSIVSGINSQQGLDATIIYPNPATDYVSVELSEPIQKANIKIMNAIGQIVYEQTVISHGNSKTIKLIDIGSFAKGIYTIVIESNKNKTFKKLIIN